MTTTRRTRAKPPLRSLERAVCRKTVRLSQDQLVLIEQVTKGGGRSFSTLVEEAFASYIPLVFRDAQGGPLAWPPMRRVRRLRHTLKLTATYGCCFSAAQDSVISYIERRHHVGYSELFDRAFGHYFPAAFDQPWPTREHRVA